MVGGWGPLCGPFAGQARSHMFTAGLELAGLLWERACPAKRPAQMLEKAQTWRCLALPRGNRQRSPCSARRAA